MKHNDMVEIIKLREYLVHYLEKNHEDLDQIKTNQICDSIFQYDTLIKKLKQLNYKLLFLKTTPFDLKKYRKVTDIKRTTNKELTEVIKEIINIVRNKECYEPQNMPYLNSNTTSDIDLISYSKEAFENIYPFTKDKTNDIFSSKKIFVFRKSLLYTLSQRDACIGQMFFDFIKNSSYILVEEKKTVKDIYTLIHEAMHAYHLLSTNHINNYEFSEVIAHSTAFFLSDYLKCDHSLKKEALICDDLIQDLIIYKIKEYASLIDDNTRNVIYENILNTLLPYTVYLKQKETDTNVTQNLIYISGNTNVLDFDYRKIGINYSDMIKSAKMLKK